MNILLPEYRRVEPVSIGLWSYMKRDEEQGKRLEKVISYQVIGNPVAREQTNRKAASQ